jgi:hypothetical protein
VNFVDDIRSNMETKYLWAIRSLESMRESARNKDHTGVQEHFWSYLHAVHAFWLYFKRWAKQERAGKPEALMETCKARLLSSEEVGLWDKLSELRNSDTHVEPVPTQEPRGGHLMKSRNGHLLRAPSGHLAKSNRTPYRVIQIGASDLDLFPLCETGLSAFRKLINDFDG